MMMISWLIGKNTKNPTTCELSVLDVWLMNWGPRHQANWWSGLYWIWISPECVQCSYNNPITHPFGNDLYHTLTMIGKMALQNSLWFMIVLPTLYRKVYDFRPGITTWHPSVTQRHAAPTRRRRREAAPFRRRKGQVVGFKRDGRSRMITMIMVAKIMIMITKYGRVTRILHTVQFYDLAEAPVFSHIPGALQKSLQSLQLNPQHPEFDLLPTWGWPKLENLDYKKENWGRLQKNAGDFSAGH